MHSYFFQLVIEYPFVSKTIRDAYKPKTERRTHHCAMTLQNEGVGYDDLNELWKNPCDLQFIMGKNHKERLWKHDNYSI